MNTVRRLSLLMCLTAACGKDPKQQPERPRTTAGTQVGAACVSDRPDSSAVVRAALALWDDDAEFLQLRVREFERRSEVTLVTLVPGRTDVLGGGGRVRVPNGGCAQVVEYFE